MTVIKELRDCAALTAEQFSQIRSHDLDYEIRDEDLCQLMQIAQDRGIPLWQVIAVATARLNRDISEHHQQVLMGV